MGFLTTITFKNDALHEFQKDPKKLGEIVIDAMSRQQPGSQTYAFNGYANYIEAQQTRHADAWALYLHSGNCVFNLNSFGKDFSELLVINLKVAKDFVKRANDILKDCKRRIKESEMKIANSFKIGDLVVAPEPNQTDTFHIGGWVGNIVEINKDMAVVADSDSDNFSIELDRLVKFP